MDITRTTPKLYSHVELHQPEKPVEQTSIIAKPINPYQIALYNCGEALI